jgi:hypothetical protein
MYCPVCIWRYVDSDADAYWLRQHLCIQGLMMLKLLWSITMGLKNQQLAMARRRGGSSCLAGSGKQQNTPKPVDISHVRDGKYQPELNRMAMPAHSSLLRRGLQHRHDGADGTPKRRVAPTFDAGGMKGSAKVGMATKRNKISPQLSLSL